MVAASVIALGGATPAQAAIIRSFAPVFSVNTNGDILMAANTLMTCINSASCTTARNATTGNYNNNSYNSRFVDVDGDASTFNSSSATVTVPTSGGVLFAALVWGGRTNATASANADPALRGNARLTVPAGAGTTSHDLTADQVDVNADYGYQGYVDVTDIVAAAGSGTYTVANVQSLAGGTNQYAGWSLVVAVSDPAAPARNLTVFSGFGVVESGDASATFPVSGFLTPPSGPVRTTLGAVTFEGDMGLTGDTFSLDSSSIGDGLNPTTNPFNSTVSRRGSQVAGRNPGYNNQLGFDADLFNADGILANSATGATISLTTVGDQYFPALVTFATDLYDPKLLGSKTVADDNAGDVVPGDILTYTIPVENIGLDTASRSRFFDAIPTGTTYLPGRSSSTAWPRPTQPTSPTTPSTLPTATGTCSPTSGRVRPRPTADRSQSPRARHSTRWSSRSP